MSTSARILLRIRRGSTFLKDFRFESEPYIYKPIQDISRSAPCVISCLDHGLLPGQLFTVQHAYGLVDLNEHSPIVPGDWRRATVLDTEHIEINGINSIPYKAYTSGGHIRYRTVSDLTGMEAELTILDRPGGTIYYSAKTEGRLEVMDPPLVPRITLDTSLQKVLLEFPDEDTATFSWKKAVFDLDLYDSSGRIFTRVNGDIVIEGERD